MQFCTHCGNQVLDEAIICPKCGCPVTDKKVSSGLSLTFNANTNTAIATCLQGLAMLLLFMPGMFLQQRWIRGVSRESENEYYSLLEILDGGTSTYGMQKTIAFLIFLVMGISVLLYCLTLFNPKSDLRNILYLLPVAQIVLFALQVMVNGNAEYYTTTGLSGHFSYSCWLLFYVEIFLLIAITIISFKIKKDATK